VKASWRGASAWQQPGLRWNLLETTAFIAFIIWGIAGLIFTLGKISPTTIAQGPIPPALIPFVQGCLAFGDPILIFLAFANTHLHAARQWSTSIARRWGAIVLIFAFIVETIGARTGFPFGAYHYTTAFGPMLGVVPLTIPLAWHVVVTNALFLVRMAAPNANHIVEALLTGAVCTAYDFILEPFATTVKHYWIWTSGAIPLQNYAAWFVLSALLVLLLSPALATRHRSDPRAPLIFGLTVLIFFAGEFR
jgi:uncharacterized membrane protein